MFTRKLFSDEFNVKCEKCFETPFEIQAVSPRRFYLKCRCLRMRVRGADFGFVVLHIASRICRIYHVNVRL